MILKSTNNSNKKNIPVYTDIRETTDIFNYSIELQNYTHLVDELNGEKSRELNCKGFSVLIPEMKCSCAKFWSTDKNLFVFCNHIKTILKNYYINKLNPLSKFFLEEKKFADNYFLLQDGSFFIIVGLNSKSDWLEIIHHNNRWIKNLYNPKESRWNHNINPPFINTSELLFNQLLEKYLKL